MAGALDGLQDVDMYTINEPDSVLRYTLADSVCSLGLILVVLVSLHVILILIWPVCVNRAYYMQVRKTTRLLPAASATFIAKRMHAAGRVMPFPGSTSDSSVSDGSHPGSQPARIADNNACVNARADVQPSIASADKLSCPCANHEPPEAPAEVANGSGDGAEPGSQPQAWTGPTGHERWKDTDKQIVDESCSLPPSPPSSPQPHMGNGIQPCAPARSGTEVTGRSRTEAPQPLDPTSQSTRMLKRFGSRRNRSSGLAPTLSKKLSVKRILKRRFRMAQQAKRIEREATFRALPAALVWPHLEVVLLITLATGQMEAATEMVTAYFMVRREDSECGKADGSNSTSATGINSSVVQPVDGPSQGACEDEKPALGMGWFLLAFSVCAALIGWLGWQLRLLVHFHRHHAKHCWVPSTPHEQLAHQSIERQVAFGASAVAGTAEDITEKVMEAMDEAAATVKQVKRSLTLVGTVRRVKRRSGTFECPVEDAREPARTEAAITHARSCCRPRGCRLPPTTGLTYDMLAPFLDGGSASRRGTSYAFVMLVLQLLVAINIGGLKRPGEANPNIAMLQIVLLGTTQLLMAVWAICGDPSDKLGGAMASLVSVFECLASVMLLAAHLSVEDPSRAVQLADLAVNMFMISIWAPLAMTLHDSVAVPVISTVQSTYTRGRRENWSGCKLASEALKAAMRLPFETARELLAIVLKFSQSDSDAPVPAAAPTAPSNVECESSKPQPQSRYGFRLVGKAHARTKGYPLLRAGETASRFALYSAVADLYGNSLYSCTVQLVTYS